VAHLSVPEVEVIDPVAWIFAKWGGMGADLSILPP
jgi:hypothetical protein